MPFEPHPSAGELPPRDTQIWRFMSLTKFLSLITSSSLYFAQTLALRDVDPFEGSLPRPNRMYHELMSTNDDFARQQMGLPQEQPVSLQMRHAFSPETWAQIQRVQAATTYVNCWHISQVESAFLWQNYASLSEGVAVRSTVGRLCDSMTEESRSVYIGKIKYINYQTEHIPAGNGFNAFFYKREGFRPEQELRACLWHLLDGVGLDPSAIVQNPIGTAVSCDTGVLIDAVLVSPQAPEWCTDVIKTVCARFGYNFRIAKSSIMDPAIL
jgi:hypothetical protein